MMKPLLATVAALALMSGVALADTSTDATSWVSEGPAAKTTGEMPAAVSTLCHFDAGPRSGQIQDYAPQHAAAIGLPCHDGKGSTGLIVAP